MPPKFLISVLGLNRVEGTKRCIEAIYANSAVSQFDLVLTNQASTDGTKEYFDSLASKYANVTIFHEKENIGFIPPNDRGFAMAIDGGYTYFIALNDDTVPPPRWLEMLVKPLLSDPRGALSGPLGTCSMLLDNMHGTGGLKYEYVEGSCLCVKVDLVKTLGRKLFSPNLRFIYGDDSDLSLRVRERGMNIHRANFHLEHIRGATVQRQPEVKKRCEEAQEANHTYLRKRWAHYLKIRRFNYPILIKRRYAIGDVLLSTALIRAIRRDLPLSPIYVQTDYPEIFRNSPNVRAAVKGLPFIPDQRDALTVDLDMTYERTPDLHIIESYALAAREVLPALGVVEHRTELNPDPSARHWADQIRRTSLGSRPFAAINMGPTTWENKNWPVERFLEVIRHLDSKGYRVVLVGGARRTNPIPGVIDLGGQTTFLKLGALLEKASLFVGVDSFPMHCAQAMNTPTVGIFGPTQSSLIMTDSPRSIGVNADPGVACAGSRHRTVGSNQVKCPRDCIDSVTTQSVLQAIAKVTQ